MNVIVMPAHPDGGGAATPRRRGDGGDRGGGLWLWWGPIVLGLLIASAGVVVATSDVRGVLSRIHGTVEGLGAWGPAVFLAIFVVWVVLALPGSWLSVMAGVLFGTAQGFVLALTGATLGAAVCFMIARYIAREPFRRLALRSRVGGVHRRIERLTRERGAMVVIIVRLVPLFPYNVTNYAFGITAVNFWTYIVWSILCMIPGTLFLVAGADAAAQVVAGGAERGVPWGLVALSAGSLAVLGVLIVLARKQLRRREEALEGQGMKGEGTAAE
jgi:uncharacterized membrane protein YdjX (TVP38/TMEM64 family)